LKGRLDIPLVVIGTGGEYKEKVKSYIKEQGLEQQVIFLSEKEGVKDLPGFKTAKDFPAIYQQAVCMIYPSIFEGFGIPVLEALWSRLPAITSNISCMPETGGNAAYYVDPSSETEMAAAMYAVATDEQLRNDMITKGWAHAQKFTQKACAAAVMDVYQKIMR